MFPINGFKILAWSHHFTTSGDLDTLTSLTLPHLLKCLCAYLRPTHIVVCFCFVFICLVYLILSVSLDYLSLIPPSVFYNVYLYARVHVSISVFITFICMLGYMYRFLFLRFSY